MDQSTIITTVASFPSAAFEMMGSLPVAVWICVAFAVVAGMLVRLLDG